MYKLYSALIVLLAAHLMCSQPLGKPINPENESPKPYSFTYDTVDDAGNTVTRTETGDGSGTVKGSYTYQNQEGVFRVVEYVADASGINYAIRTNEPGTGKTENGDPANVAMNVEPPPQDVVARWLQPREPSRVGGRTSSIIRRR